MTFEDFYCGFTADSHPAFSVSPTEGKMERRNGPPTQVKVTVKPSGRSGEHNAARGRTPGSTGHVGGRLRCQKENTNPYCREARWGKEAVVVGLCCARRRPARLDQLAFSAVTSQSVGARRGRAHHTRRPAPLPPLPPPAKRVLRPEVCRPRHTPLLQANSPAISASSFPRRSHSLHITKSPATRADPRGTSASGFNK
jgi:hypothetical protein